MSNRNQALNLTIKVNGAEVDNTFKAINSNYYKLRNSVNKLTEGTEEWYEANRELAKVEVHRKKMIATQKSFREELQNTTSTTDEQTSAMTAFGQSFSDAFSSLKNGDIMGFRDGMKGVASGIGAATKAGLAFIATPIGAAIAVLTGIVLATREWSKYNEAAVEANRTTQQLTQLSGEALDSARVRATALEKTFGGDFKKNIEVAASLVNAFGISYKEAFDRIENGLIRGGKENGEFLDSMKEYPKLFAQAGFTVEDFQRIVNTGMDMKIYSDKLPDAIKEFSLAIMEETLPAREALENAFGKEFTNEIFTNIQNGSITSKDALGLIAAEAENIGMNAQQAQLLTADLFKGAGEDAGGALVIFEAVNTALNEQERALTPLEEGLKSVADANLRLEQAQNDALKSDQYAAFANEISVSWTNLKANFFEGLNSILEGFVSVDTAFRKFMFQSVQYTKDAFTIGADADWDKLGAQFDKKQKEMEIRAAAMRDAEKPKEEGAPDGKNDNGLKQQEAAKKKAEEALKLSDSKAKAAIAEEKKRLDAIDALEAEYKKKGEDREADSAIKKAELDQQRAIEKATSLGAEQELIDQITAEHQIKIDEAKLAEEEKELERLRSFEAKKLELENELELAKATTDEEKAAIRKEQELEKEEALFEDKMAKFEEEMSFLEMTEDEKNSVIEKLKEAHENTVLGIQKKATDEKIKDANRLNEEKKRLISDSLDAAISAAGAESKVGQALLIIKQILAARETAIQLGLFANKMALNVGEATGAAATGAAETAKVGFPQNIPLLIGFGIQIAGIISAVKSAASAKSGVKTSFARGGFTDLFGMGYKDSTGHEVAGDVHVNEYVVPEVVRRDPEVPPILNYLENKRKKKLGLYADGGDASGDLQTSSTPIPSRGTSENRQILLLEAILAALGITGDIFFGFEAEQKRQEAEAKLNKIKERSKIKRK